MFRKYAFLIGLLLLLISPANIGTATGYVPGVGESLEYKIYVKSIFGGNQTIKVVAQEKLQGVDVLRIESVLESAGLLGSLAPYSEKEDLILDMTGYYPWFARREIHDKDKSSIEEVTFNYQNHTAVRLFSQNGGPMERSEVKLPDVVHDGLSFQFYLRNANLEKAQRKTYFYSNGRVEEATYQITESNEPVKVDFGKFTQTFQIDHPKSNYTIVIAKTPERYPVLIRKNASFGRFEAKLSKVRKGK